MAKRQTWLSIVLLWFFSACAFASGISYTWPSSTWVKLNYGIYWLHEVNGKQIYCPSPGSKNAATVPTCKTYHINEKAPTLLFIHGWEDGSIASHNKSEFNVKQWDLAKAWLKKGWNVGIFYWNQFADEADVLNAEAKIWTTTGASKMHWRHYKTAQQKELTYSPFCQANKPCQNVTDLLYQAYLKAMQNYQGQQIRIVGHSLGAQLAINLSYRVGKAIAKGSVAANLMPKRLVLLDPFYTYGYASKLNQEANFVVKQFDIPIVTYLSSELTWQDWYLGPVSKYAVITRYYPEFCSIFNETAGELCAHSAAWHMYFLSYKDAPPRGYMLKNYIPVFIGDAASASTPYAKILTMVNRKAYWQQSSGNSTLNTSNDSFLYVKADVGQQASYASRSQSAPLCLVHNFTIPALHHASYVTGLVGTDKFVISMANLPTNHTLILNAKIQPSSASDPLILWCSSNSAIVQVLGGDFIKIKHPGQVVLTATAVNHGHHKVTKKLTLDVME